MCQWLVENIKYTSQSIYYIHCNNAIGLATASWENLLKSHEKNKEI